MVDDLHFDFDNGMSNPKMNSCFHQNITSDPDKAIHWLNTKQVLTYPTESVWGVGCDAFCESAIQALLTLKSRPVDKGFIVLTDKVERILPLLVHLDSQRQHDIVARLTKNTTTDQATTWLLPVQNMPKFLTGEYDTLAVRITQHPLLQQLCRGLVSAKNPYGFLVSTSCNRSNQAPAKNFGQAWQYFGDTVHYLKGESLGFDKPSQIIEVQTGRVIR